MAVLNHDIDNLKCLIRLSHFTKKSEDFDKFCNAYLFGVQSVAGKILTFHAMTDFGMLRSRIPISEVFLHVPTNDIPFHFKQLWDCFSENVTVITYDYLYEKRCEVVLRDGSKVWASYLFTVDWYRNSYSDEPSDYKCGHVLVADDGYLLCMPNNRIYWRDSNWVTKSFPVDVKEIKVDDELLSVETVSDKWVSESSDSYYYEIKKVENDKV
jgi:hypothetical protein